MPGTKYKQVKDKQPGMETYLAKVSSAESGDNPSAKNPNGSATGLFQFTESTWTGLNDKYKFGYSLEDRKNPEKSANVMRKFTEDNEAVIAPVLGREINDADRYMAHFLGAGGARRFFTAYNTNPNAPISAVVSQKALQDNKQVFYNKDGSLKTLSNVYGWATEKMDTDVKPKVYTPTAQINTEVYESEYFQPELVSSSVPLLSSTAVYQAPVEKADTAEVQKAKQEIAENSFVQELGNILNNAQPQEVQQPVQPEIGFDPAAYDYINIEEYQAGGTIVTNNPRDPRIQAYKDSLSLYNNAQRRVQIAKKDINTATDVPRITRGKNFTNLVNADAEAFERLSELNGRDPYPIQTYKKRFRRDLNGNDAVGDEIELDIYKYPKQPVVYQPSVNQPIQRQLPVSTPQRPDVKAANVQPEEVIDITQDINVQPLQNQEPSLKTYGEDRFQNRWRAEGRVATTEERKANPNWDRDTQIVYLKDPATLGVNRQTSYGYSQWNDSYNNLVEGEDFLYYTPDSFQDGGNVEADKAWLQNWYSNRVIPDKGIQNLYEEDKPYFEELSQFIPDPTIVDEIEPGNPYITGRYEGDTNKILLTPNAAPSTFLHEGTHRTQNFSSAMRPVHEDIVKQNVFPKDQLEGYYKDDYDYFTDPDEVHARIQVLRNEAGIQPNQKVTPMFLQNFLRTYQGGDSNINDLLKLTDENGLLQMLNYMASNNTNTDNNLV